MKESQLLTNNNLAPRMLGTERFIHVLRAFLAGYTYAMKHGLIRELFFHHFLDRDVAAPPLNGARSLQLVLGNSQAKARRPYEMAVSTVFKIDLNFHATVLIREVGKEKLNIDRIVVDSTLAVMSAQFVQAAWDILTASCSIGPLRAVIKPYIWFHSTMI